MTQTGVDQKILALANDRASETPAFGSVSGGRAQRLLSPAKLGELLSHPLVRYPQVRVALAGKAVAPAEYTTTRRIGTQTVDDGIDGHAVAKWLTRGATITLDSLEYLSEGVRQICDTLSAGLGLRATATAYVTPPGRQGLNPHTDEEDVFVLQTFGTKSWIVDSGQRQRVPKAAGFPFNDAMQAVPARILQPGEMFYMPAGTPHVATAQDNLSIHITFSVERPRIHDLLAQALTSLAVVREELNELQPWGTPLRLSLDDVLQSAQRFEVESSKDPVSDDLPFESWETLPSNEIDVRLTSTVSFQETESGYSLHFPDFTMKVGEVSGRSLLPLQTNGRVRLSLDDEGDLRPILFHLSGRGVVRTARESVNQ